MPENITIREDDRGRTRVWLGDLDVSNVVQSVTVHYSADELPEAELYVVLRGASVAAKEMDVSATMTDIERAVLIAAGWTPPTDAS